jgi:hypothetical protein
VLHDGGMQSDDVANDGWYTGVYQFKSISVDPLGDWYLIVLAQDVNTALEGTPPLEAVRIIGGSVLTPQLELKFNQPCALHHDAVIRVV